MSIFDDAGKDSSKSESETVRRAFAALPLDQKLATLVQVELDMLGDAFNTVVATASRIADEIADAFTEPKVASPGPDSPNSANL